MKSKQRDFLIFIYEIIIMLTAIVLLAALCR